MEENNNDEKTIVDKGKEAVKEASKEAGKKVAKKVIQWAWPAISTFLLILLAFGVINLVVYAIQSFFSSLLGIFSSSQEASSSSTSSINQTKSIIYIEDDGAYAFNTDFAGLIAEELERQKVDTESLGFSVDEFGDMLETYVKTEVQTMFPKIGSYAKDGLDGTIVIKRASTDGKTTTLTYEPYNTFKKSVNFNKFSINPENFKLCIYVTERY